MTKTWSSFIFCLERLPSYFLFRHPLFEITLRTMGVITGQPDSVQFVLLHSIFVPSPTLVNRRRSDRSHWFLAATHRKLFVALHQTCGSSYNCLNRGTDTFYLFFLPIVHFTQIFVSFWLLYGWILIEVDYQRYGHYVHRIELMISNAEFMEQSYSLSPTSHMATRWWSFESLSRTCEVSHWTNCAAIRWSTSLLAGLMCFARSSPRAGYYLVAWNEGNGTLRRPRPAPLTKQSNPQGNRTMRELRNLLGTSDWLPSTYAIRMNLNIFPPQTPMSMVPSALHATNQTD